MDESLILNASPLIFLARGAQLDLLRLLAHQILVPEPVAHEIFQRGLNDETVRAVQQSPFIQIVAPPLIPPAIERWGLGAGESSVLALSLTLPGSVPVLDDLLGRKCALALGMPVRGTLGLVLLAKRRGLIPQARPVLEQLIRGGMFLSRGILDAALQRVDE